MPQLTRDSAGIIPLVCFELLALAFAMVAARMARTPDTITASEPDAQPVVSAVPPDQEAVTVA